MVVDISHYTRMSPTISLDPVYRTGEGNSKGDLLLDTL
jgi:hypothetical protein